MHPSRIRKLARLKAALAISEADLAAGRFTTQSSDEELAAFFARLCDGQRPPCRRRPRPGSRYARR